MVAPPGVGIKSGTLGCGGRDERRLAWRVGSGGADVLQGRAKAVDEGIDLALGDHECR